MKAKRVPWWKRPPVTIPIAISLLLAALGYATYRDQHGADALQAASAVASAATARSAAAQLVSFSQAPGSSGVVVENLGQRPLYDAALVVVAELPDPGLVGVEPPEGLIGLGYIGPCSRVAVDVHQVRLLANMAADAQDIGAPAAGYARQMLKGGSWVAVASNLVFTDANGLTWTDYYGGGPDLLSPSQTSQVEHFSTAVLSPGQVTNAAGCS